MRESGHPSIGLIDTTCGYVLDVRRPSDLIRSWR